MAVNETIVTGRKWRRCIDVANKLWQRISYWTKASDVEFDDGQTAENKMGAISGITSDLNGESEKIAASIKAVNQLNNNLVQMSNSIGMDLLWTNPNPSSSALFPPQTISLNLTGYKFIEIYFFACIAEDSYNVPLNHDKFLIDDTYPQVLRGMYVSSITTGSASICSRSIKVSSTGIQFYGGFNDTNNYNGYCRPYKIYGVK